MLGRRRGDRGLTLWPRDGAAGETSHGRELFRADGKDLDVDVARLREMAVTDARQRLHELIPQEAQTYCTVETAVVEGRAYREILRRASEQRAELIVMGVHGRGAVDLFVFGSTTHHVIRASTCPLLIVRGA